ncbi:hypothetical protein BCR36DRAFT_402165 [Piromyces finnis]|uniref:Uncharacterized protein n=1 Tax=Piromyces finnis TaxID=1754191 RepID=A0A1Y1VJA3_9FUNG|nr:hypothetical protein BCR36DRAFT_402165 [Piromyces finnis]|eukprot:ORX57744.1 hypothetical protein BCR36DRAFT_402165 [Piromyces finnis]
MNINTIQNNNNKIEANSNNNDIEKEIQNIHLLIKSENQQIKDKYKQISRKNFRKLKKKIKRKIERQKHAEQKLLEIKNDIIDEKEIVLLEEEGEENREKQQKQWEIREKDIQRMGNIEKELIRNEPKNTIEKNGIKETNIFKVKIENIKYTDKIIFHN